MPLLESLEKSPGFAFSPVIGLETMNYYCTTCNYKKNSY